MTNTFREEKLYDQQMDKEDNDNETQFLQCFSSLSSRVLGHCCWRILVEFLVTIFEEFVKSLKLKR